MMQDTTGLKVFISSTKEDLEEYRAAVRDTVLSFELLPIMMEYLPAMDSSAVDLCMEKVDQCPVYIGIFAHRYGYRPHGSSTSITEMEFERATEQGKERLCFLIDPKTPWPPHYIEGEPGKTMLDQFKGRIETNLVRGTFTNPDNLALQVFKALYAFLQRPRANFRLGDNTISEISKPVSMADDSSSARIRLTLHETIENADQPLIKNLLSALLRVNSSEIEIVHSIKGSTIMLLELPAQAAHQLYRLVMQTVPLPQDLPLPALVRQAEAELDNFNRSSAYDERYSLELARLAFAEESSEAFKEFHRLYTPLARRWTSQHPLFARTGETEDYIVNGSWSSLYSAIRGSRFDNFNSLRQVLAYLKTIIHSVISQQARRQAAAPLTLDIAESMPLNMEWSDEQLWDVIRDALLDENDRLLAYLWLQMGYKPHEIAAEYPQQWPTSREVSLRIYIIRRQLRRNQMLAELFRGK
jgi:hypothetical protein